jgi:hypothetical protein
MKRSWVLGVVTVAGIGAAAVQLVGGPRTTVANAPESAISAQRERPFATSTSSLSELSAGLQRSTLQSNPRADLFGGDSDPKRPVAAPPEVAVKPPLLFPYRYAGTTTHADKVTAVLIKGSEVRFAEAGDSIDGIWRVNAIGSERVEVTFIATGEAVIASLSTGGSDESPNERAIAQFTPSTQTEAARPEVAVPGRLGRSGASTAVPSAAGNGAAGNGGFASAAARPSAPQQPSRVAQAQTSAPSSEGTINTGAIPSGRLGQDAPTAGSMPVGPPPTSKGRLGL